MLFSRRQIIFSFFHISFEMSLSVHSEIDSSVRLYHDIQTNSWTSFLSLIFNIIHQWIRLLELYTLMESFFSNFKFIFKILNESRKMFKRIVRCEY